MITPRLHKTIHDVLQSFNNNSFDSFIKLDVQNFYPSINHCLLLKNIKKNIRKKEILTVIEQAISKPTVYNYSSIYNSSRGLPQGLAISNILANIYMNPIDIKYSHSNLLKYFRFVDDILILCNKKNIPEIKTNLSSDCQKLGLNFHDDADDKSKTKIGYIAEGFSYLGYSFIDSLITVREKSICKLRQSIISIFTSYKYEKRTLKQLEWHLNLRITGCIFNDSRYGWLFFFSQINDKKLLFSLDSFIKKLLIRFEISIDKIKIRNFVKSYHEIRQNIRNTKYIPNFDSFTIPQKRKLLYKIFNLKKQRMTSSEINYQFNIRVFSIVKILEKDLARPS